MYGRTGKSLQLTKVKLLQTLVFPIISYACEMWTLKTDVTHKLEAFEMQCYCHLLKNQVARSHCKCGSSNSTWFLHQIVTATHDQEAPGRVAGACGIYASKLAAKYCPAWLHTRKASIMVATLRDGLKPSDLISI